MSLFCYGSEKNEYISIEKTGPSFNEEPVFSI